MRRITDRLEQLLELGGMKKDLACLIISGIALLCSMFPVLPFPFEGAWIAVVLCGLPIILEAIIGLITEFDIKADVLVSIALVASLCIGEVFAAGEVAFIMQIGAFLEEFTVGKARAGIEKLVKLTPQTARVVEQGQERMIPVQQVEAGSRIRVLPGETIPVDGVILSGQTSVDQGILTGESVPVDKEEGSEVFSGTINQFGSFDMEAVRVGEDSSIQKMIRLVQSADAGKAEIVGIADRWATWIVVIALTAAAFTWALTGEIIRAVTILVVFCPCALVLATPTAIMAAISNCSKHGFLVKEGDALERLSRVSKICFDKTGTLTVGKPKVLEVQPVQAACTREELYRIAAMTEKLSEHPLAKAIVDCYLQESGCGLKEAEDFVMVPGRGVSATVEGKQVLAGNLSYLQAEGVDIRPFQEMEGEYLEQGCTLVYMAVDGEAAGLIAMADSLREGMADTMEKIMETGVNPVLLTGDNHKAANRIAGQVHIAKVMADCLPENKLQYIQQSQSLGHQVCMIGDGINDAPALKQAHVGIAMGAAGSDIAVDAADIVMAEDRIEELPHLLALSGKMMRTIRGNMAFSLILNALAILLAITGILNPVAGALVHNSGSVFVILNSVALLNWREHR
ncbi:MAG: cation-translocating P-type ATPase [Lachnospiraceae bacterium]|nr:cation-translocating P-type ATPase [Lachnospiraceae bacterium]